MEFNNNREFSIPREPVRIVALDKSCVSSRPSFAVSISIALLFVRVGGDSEVTNFQDCDFSITRQALARQGNTRRTGTGNAEVRLNREWLRQAFRTNLRFIRDPIGAVHVCWQSHFRVTAECDGCASEAGRFAPKDDSLQKLFQHGS